MDTSPIRSGSSNPLKAELKPGDSGAPGNHEPSWLNRNVTGMTLASLLSDASHEMATAALPGFLEALGISAAALGAIEGIADCVSSVTKLGAGWYSDRLSRRKPLIVAGYFLTGISQGVFAWAQGWALILIGRVLGWFGRGVRSPLRNVILSASAPAKARGKAFGFHRAGDTIGAVIGPLIAVWVLARLHYHGHAAAHPFRLVFLLTLIPGLGACIVFAAMVRETSGQTSAARLWTSIRSLPGSFGRLLVGVGVFGAGDFAPALIILAATQLLTPAYGMARAAELGALLYAVHNVFYAGCSYPVGALSDRLGRRGLLVAGYAAGALAALGFAAAFAWRLASPAYLLLLFALAGIAAAAVDSLEGAITADHVTDKLRGTAYGAMGLVNGIGDLIASVAVGGLWTLISPACAFDYAAIAMALGATLLAVVK
ncbi:MAG: MFS transporter [Terriglobia bacterium]